MRVIDGDIDECDDAEGRAPGPRVIAFIVGFDGDFFAFGGALGRDEVVWRSDVVGVGVLALLGGLIPVGIAAVGGGIGVGDAFFGAFEGDAWEDEDGAGVWAAVVDGAGGDFALDGLPFVGGVCDGAGVGACPEG